MSGSLARRSSAPLVLAVVLAVLAIAAQWAASPADTAARSRWTGSIDLYRTGTFTTQKSWLWCTAADVQIIRNIARRARDHSTASQRRYFAYMRAHNRYDIPVSDGVDPAGWTAGLRHYVDRRYRLVASTSFDAALRSAVTNLRRANLPVGITVARGNHAWVLTGFSATADPATTKDFRVTSVRVVGPLWGLQSRSYGYDMRPDKKLTPKQLRGFFTAWHYAGVRMAWEGRWVSIQPVAAASTSTPKPTSRPTPRATPEPTSTPTRTPSLSPTPTSTASPAPALPPPASIRPVAVALGEPSMPATLDRTAPTDAVAGVTDSAMLAAIALVALTIVALLGGATLRTRCRPPR